MNITDTETPLSIMAKTCGHSKRSRRVTYAFVDFITVFALIKKRNYILRYNYETIYHYFLQQA